MLWMSLLEFSETWKLTEDQMRREFASGRLIPHGKRESYGWSDVRIYYPQLVKWVRAKSKMPHETRLKVDAAGGLERVDQFRRDQISKCLPHPLTNEVTLPDGTTLVMIYEKGTKEERRD